MSLNEQRLGAVLAAIRASGARRVLDLGCGEGRLLRELLEDRQFEEIVGMDVSIRSLETARDRLRLDRLPERQAARIKLIHGSLIYRDRRLEGFDAAAVVEVVEHLDPPRLSAFERVLFEFARPGTVVLTTPNREYNVMWENVGADRFRHPDHRFEWTRHEFRDWAEGIAGRFGYAVRFQPVGPVDEAVGSPTQMGVFDAIPAPKSEGDLMSDFLDRLRAELAARGPKIIDAGTAGIGVEFRDGYDVWWLLPDDPLSSVPVPPSGHADPRAILEEYGRLDALRSRAIHAIRHHLADRGVRTARIRSGSWPIQNGACSSQLSVGASLTARFAGSDDVVAAVRGVFATSIVRSPSPRRIQRYLAREGDPPDELPWLDEPPAIVSGQTPTAILAMMGLCKAIRLRGETADRNRLRPEEMAEVVQPKGRIGRALARFAAALPDTRASLELIGGIMTIDFDDGLDCYRIQPRSRDLVAAIRRDGPERGGRRPDRGVPEAQRRPRPGDHRVPGSPPSGSASTSRTSVPGSTTVAACARPASISASR